MLILTRCRGLHDQLLRLKQESGSKLSNVFTYRDPRNGKLRPLKTVRRAFVMACKRAKIENLRFHDLRHTVASRLVEKGADPVSVQILLGHANLKTTEIYLHSGLKQMHQAVSLLDRRKTGEPGQTSPICHRPEGPDFRQLTDVFFSVN